MKPVHLVGMQAVSSSVAYLQSPGRSSSLREMGKHTKAVLWSLLIMREPHCNPKTAPEMRSSLASTINLHKPPASVKATNLVRDS